MPITSDSGEISGNYVTFDRSDQKGAGRGSGVICYINYSVVGPSDATIGISYEFSESGIEDGAGTWYAACLVETNLDPIAFNLPAATTGQYRLPLSMAQNEEQLRILFSGYVDGTLNVEFRIDNPYR